MTRTYTFRYMLDGSSFKIQETFKLFATLWAHRAGKIALFMNLISSLFMVPTASAQTELFDTGLHKESAMKYWVQVQRPEVLEDLSIAKTVCHD